jgi:saccharopine dehydrogenase (NAD+, L-glutamate forming)
VRQTQQAHKQRRQAEPRDERRRVRLAAKPHRALGYWALPLPTIDPQVIATSARALERYGPDFAYGHYAAVKKLPVAVAGVGGLASLFAMAQVPPVRKALLGRLAPGDGPSEEQRAKGWFKVRFVGEGGGKRVLTEVAGGDPGYTETAKMLAESALCLAQDDLPPSSGQVTTAVAMGDALIARLQRAAISFRVVDS